ncbi:diphthine synthase [Vulcanisaeta thermophila]|uniref:diphthine synthase n=1 Tax=Vulcanisaeta thermophila TaxID=867917 RepID=UPI0008538B21|nr:diphthine synthase [Vulcanisaeta thermophila]
MRKTTLYIVGVGLGVGHLTREALDIIRSVDHVFLETYTSMHEDINTVISQARGGVRILTRTDLEDRNAEEIIRVLREGRDAALLVIGDPMIATSHASVAYIVRRMGFEVKIVNSVSILCAALSQAGLSPYKLGPVATVTYPRINILSHRAYEVLRDNLSRGLHTLLLLDIKDDGSFMGINEAVELLMRMEGEEGLGIINDDLMGIFMARIGWRNQEVRVSSITKVPSIGDPPHVIIIPGELNPVEMDYLVQVLNADNELIQRHQRLVKRLMTAGTH